MEDRPIAPTDKRYVEEYGQVLDNRSLDPLRLWQSFVHFKKLPTLDFLTLPVQALNQGRKRAREVSTREQPASGVPAKRLALHAGDDYT
jgi:hypothetical protein